MPESDVEPIRPRAPRTLNDALPGSNPGQPAYIYAALAALDTRDHPGTSESIVTASATGRVQALGGALSEAEMRAVLTVAVWPLELHAEALAVSWCESKWSPYADNGTDRGLFQMSFSPAATLRGSWYAYYGVDEALWPDPVTNARVARWVYERSGWGPWNCKP